MQRVVRGCPMRRAVRRSDGVCGLHVCRPVSAGAVLLVMPFRYCFFPHGLAAASLSCRASSSGTASLHDKDDVCRQARRVRSCNRGNVLLPEVWQWLCRLSPDAAQDKVSLSATLSYNGAQYEEDRADVDGPSVLSLNVTPVEAAVAVCVTLRYFFSTTLAIPAVARKRLGLGPVPNDRADRWVRSLPIPQYLVQGVESLAVSRGDGLWAGEAHACLEQIAWNLRDAVLTHANADEYRLIDRHVASLDELLLCALYIVRARVLRLPMLHGPDPRDDRVVSVLAPGLDAVNHSALTDNGMGGALVSVPPSAAAVVSLPQGAVVLRATRALRAGEEVTLCYSDNSVPCGRQSGTEKGVRKARSGAGISSYELVADDLWESRYLIGECDA